MNDPTKNQDEKAPSESAALSLDQLKGAFAEMLGDSADAHTPNAIESAVNPTTQAAPTAATDRREDERCEITPRSILEAMFFVGNADNTALNAQHIASLMRGVHVAEIDALLGQLNQIYAREGAPYEIVSEGAGYRMALREQHSRTRDKFYGRARDAKLSQAAIEVLSIVAYNQPVTTDQVNKFRGATSGAVLSQLVRRHLLRVERFENQPRITHYSTTDRFLRIFGLDCLGDLPRSDDLQQQ